MLSMVAAQSRSPEMAARLGGELELFADCI